MSLIQRCADVRGWAEKLGLPLHPNFPAFVDEGQCLSIDVEQGSAEWELLRCGIPTTSALAKVITEARMDYSAGAEGYIADLVVESILGQPLKWGETAWTVRGHELEPEARAWYELERGVTVRQVGFLMAKDGSEGGSPDGLVGDDGLVEIKNFGAQRHIRCLFGLEKIVTKPQAQGLLRLTGRKWIDCLAYNPVLPKCLIRIYRDEPFIAKLDEHMVKFKADRAKVEEKLALIGTARIDDSLEAAILKAELEASLAVEADADALIDEMYPPNLEVVK